MLKGRSSVGVGKVLWHRSKWVMVPQSRYCLARWEKPRKLCQSSYPGCIRTQGWITDVVQLSWLQFRTFQVTRMRDPRGINWLCEGFVLLIVLGLQIFQRSFLKPSKVSCLRVRPHLKFIQDMAQPSTTWLVTGLASMYTHLGYTNSVFHIVEGIVGLAWSSFKSYCVLLPILSLRPLANQINQQFFRICIRNYHNNFTFFNLTSQMRHRFSSVLRTRKVFSGIEDLTTCSITQG